MREKRRCENESRGQRDVGPRVQECVQFLEAEKGKKEDFPLRSSEEMQFCRPSLELRLLRSIRQYTSVKAIRFVIICYSSNRK